MSELVDRVANPVQVAPAQLYRQIGVRSHGKGLFDKEAVTGTALGEKRVFWVEPNCFVVNIVFAWEQAVAKTSEEDRGKIASHRFPMFRPREGKIELDYLTYLFKTDLGKHLLGLASPGGAGRNKTLGQTEFMRIQIPCPPIREQEKIVDILSTWDAAIQKAEKLAALSVAHKGALMQQLFTGKVRLENRKGPFFSHRLGELAFIDRRSLDSRTPPDFAFNYISLSEVSTGFISGNPLRLEFQNAPSRARRIVEPGDILMSTVRPNLKAFAMYRGGLSPCVASTGFAVLSAKQGVSAAYLYHYLFGHSISAQIDALVVGSSYPAINSSDVANLEVLAPSLEEQNAIASVLDNAEAIIHHRREQVAHLVQERAALLQQLLSGKRRVKTRKEAA